MKIINLNQNHAVIDLVTTDDKVYAVTTPRVRLDEVLTRRQMMEYQHPDEEVLPTLEHKLPPFNSLGDKLLTLQLFDVTAERTVGKPKTGRWDSGRLSEFSKGKYNRHHPSPDGWTTTKTTKQNLKGFGDTVVQHETTRTVLAIPAQFLVNEFGDAPHGRLVENNDLMDAYYFFLKTHGVKDEPKNDQFIVIKDGKAEAFRPPTNDVLIAAALTESNACVATRHTIFTIDI